MLIKCQNKNWKSIFTDKNHNYNIRSKQNLPISKIIYPHLSEKKLNLSYKYICCELFNLKKKDIIIDFGSGAGNFLLYCQKKFDVKKISIEINNELIKYQKKFLKKTKYILWKDNINKVPIKIKYGIKHYLIIDSVLQYLHKKNIFRLLNFFIKNFDKILLVDIKNKKKEKAFYARQEKKYNTHINRIYSKKNQLTFFYKKELILYLKKFRKIKYKFIKNQNLYCSDEGFSLIIEKLNK